MPGEITIYSDGASSGNPGPGGYGVVLISGRHRLEKSEGFLMTTNNRMELLAVIAGLEALKIRGSKVVVYTDSRYVADSVNKGWVFQWESKNFRKKKNSDLWMRFLRIYRNHTVRFVWIKGHASNPENEVCDRLAVEAYKNKDLKEDTGYNPEEENNMLFNESKSI
jgi:ribonuclease HI